jgi:hypothetical protein
MLILNIPSTYKTLGSIAVGKSITIRSYEVGNDTILLKELPVTSATAYSERTITTLVEGYGDFKMIANLSGQFLNGHVVHGTDGSDASGLGDVLVHGRVSFLVCFVVLSFSLSHPCGYTQIIHDF